ncbi:hypothetical protein Syun_028004 [Stephania yunnanensis]|uniref:Uncharacterized protein n=1 Tax=Stephania yunnanensis TaxID=152371 RepID=A0AAP0EM47_9MAGN
MNELYLHLHTVNHDGMTFIDTRSERFYDMLQTRRLELTQATPDQPVDDEAVYLNVAGECPKGHVYDLGSLGKKNRRYADPGASTSQMPEMVPRAEFDIVADQLRKVMAFMHQQFGMTMDRAGLSRPHPPPPPHDHQQPPQIDPADPPQQGDNVERETQDMKKGYARFAVDMFVKPSPGLPSTHHRMVACSFRDQALFQLFQISMSRLKELALSLAHKCLSFDFVGTSLDESSKEFSTVQARSAWRQVLEDPSNLQIFFDYYAIAKPPISKENQVKALKEKKILVEYLSSTLRCLRLEKRPSYRKLSSLRNHLPSVPILALTATAVPKVQKDVIESLCLENPVVLRSSFNRPNIFYEADLILANSVDELPERLIGAVRVSHVELSFAIVQKLEPETSLNCSEGAVGVNGSHGFRNLAGSVVQLLGLVGDAITSAKANTFSVFCIDVGISNRSETELLYSVSNPLLIKDGSETESNNSVSDPLLIKDGSETDLLDSVSDLLLIKDGSETKLLDSVSDPLLIRDGSETELLDSISDPLLIRDGSKTKLLYSVSDPLLIRDGSETKLLYSISDPLLIRDGIIVFRL